VPAADGGIAQADFLGFGDFEEVGLGFALDVVGHVLAQLGAGMIEQPEPAKGVFDEVANNPVRGEELGDGGNVLGGHGALAGHDLVFLFRNIELVEPTENFHFAAILIADLGAKAVDDGLFGQQIVGQKQLGLVVEFLKDVRQQGVVKMAGRQHEAAINFTLRIRSRESCHRGDH
jgi:hypothetical protein